MKGFVILPQYALLYLKYRSNCWCRSRGRNQEHTIVAGGRQGARRARRHHAHDLSAIWYKCVFKEVMQQSDVNNINK